mgnify:CR=1 FL=1
MRGQRSGKKIRQSAWCTNSRREGSGKKEKKKGAGGSGVPKHTGLAVTAVVIVLAAAVLSFDSFYTLSEEEMAVVTTFGKPAVEEASGLHFENSGDPARD